MFVLCQEFLYVWPKFTGYLYTGVPLSLCLRGVLFPLFPGLSALVQLQRHIWEMLPPHLVSPSGPLPWGVVGTRPQGEAKFLLCEDSNLLTTIPTHLMVSSLPGGILSFGQVVSSRNVGLC